MAGGGQRALGQRGRLQVLGILKDRLGDELDETAVFAILAACPAGGGGGTLLRSLFLAGKVEERDEFEIHTRYKVAAVGSAPPPGS